MGECFFWYWPTWVVQYKRPLNVCVCACVRACVCVNKDFIVSGVLLSMNVKFFVFDSTRIHIV